MPTSPGKEPRRLGGAEPGAQGWAGERCARAEPAGRQGLVLPAPPTLSCEAHVTLPYLPGSRGHQINRCESALRALEPCAEVLTTQAPVGWGLRLRHTGKERGSRRREGGAGVGAGLAAVGGVPTGSLGQREGTAENTASGGMTTGARERVAQGASSRGPRSRTGVSGQCRPPRQPRDGGRVAVQRGSL